MGGADCVLCVVCCMLCVVCCVLCLYPAAVCTHRLSCGRHYRSQGLHVCCAVSCCVVLCCAVLCCGVLCCAVLCCAVLCLCMCMCDSVCARRVRAYIVWVRVRCAIVCARVRCDSCSWSGAIINSFNLVGSLRNTPYMLAMHQAPCLHQPKLIITQTSHTCSGVVKTQNHKNR